MQAVIWTSVVFFPEPLGEAAQALSDNDQTPDKNKKKNRCFSCRKKVGLTGKEDETFSHLHTYQVESSSSLLTEFKG